MEIKLLTVFLGIIAGGAGYLVVKFWMEPLLRYVKIKHEVASDLIFYANVIDATNLNEEMQDRKRHRQESNRRHAAEIRACYYSLPIWYRFYLKKVGEDPISASKALIGLSNSNEYVHGENFIDRLGKALRMPEGFDE